MSSLSEKFLGLLGRARNKPGGKAGPAPSQVAEQPTRIRRRPSLGRRIAVQFQDGAVCLAAAKSNGLRTSLLAVKKVDVPGDLATEELRQEFISQAIARFTKKHGGYGPEIRVALSGREATFRTFSMPSMSARELKSAIAFEVKKQIPFPIDECFFDYRRVARIQTAERERDRIALQAATRRYVKQLIEPFRKLNLAVNQVHFAQEALGPLLSELPDFNRTQAQAVITLTEDRSEISFFRGAQLEFHRSGSVGTGSLGAEPDDYQLESFVDALASEVQTSFDFYSGQYGRRIAGRIYLIGLVPSAGKLTSLLAQSVGAEFVTLPVEQLPSLSIGQAGSADELSCCIGAVAVATCDAVIGNLAPDLEKKALRQHRLLVYSRAATLVVAACLASSWYFMHQDNSIRSTELRQLESQLTYLKGTEAYVTYQVLKRQVAASQAFVEEAKETPSHFHANLKELSHLTPENIRLNRLILDSQAPIHGMTIEGTVVSGEIPPELTLAEYVERLAASPFYRDVTIERHIKRRQKQGFEIDFTLAMAGGI